MTVIKVYVSQVCGNTKMRSQQDYIRRTLEIKGIQYEQIDIGDPHHEADKKFMQEKLKLSDDDLVALPPQVFKDKDHKGDFDGFFTAVECEEIFSYLDIDIPQSEVEFQRKQEPERGPFPVHTQSFPSQGPPGISIGPVLVSTL